MKANPLSINDIFGHTVRYTVPLFQRPYVWDRELQLLPFWDDLRQFAERIEDGTIIAADKLDRNETLTIHFLGTIVLDQTLHATAQVGSRWVIDGQQRLTTLQLFLEAFAGACELLGNKPYTEALRQLTHNHNPLSKDPNDQFKVWPTNTDQEDFARVMRAGSPAQVKALYGKSAEASAVGHHIADAYLFFHHKVAEWLQVSSEVESRITALHTATCHHLQMVVIDLFGQDDPQLIFETLNARGTPLLPSDLVKNFLFHRAKINGEPIQELYDQYWRPFDANEKYWRKLQGRGHASRAQIDIFLQYYLSARLAEEVSVGRLYSAFRDFAMEPVQGSSAPSVRELLSELHRYALIFMGFDQLEANSRISTFFERLRTLGALTAYPFLLELFARFEKEPEQILQILGDVESFLIRRMICQLNTRGYNRLFIELVDLLKSAEGAAASQIRQYLLEGQAESRRWPSGQEMTAAFLHVPLYKRLESKRMRMLLEAIERSLHGKLSEKIEFKGSLTVEHVMPEAWRQHWAPDEGTKPEGLDLIVHTIGNLTLVNDKLNPAMSNGAWETKRDKLVENSLLRLNRYFASRETWKAQDILERGTKLAEAAEKVWPHPQDLK